MLKVALVTVVKLPGAATFKAIARALVATAGDAKVMVPPERVVVIDAATLLSGSTIDVGAEP